MSGIRCPGAAPGHPGAPAGVVPRPQGGAHQAAPAVGGLHGGPAPPAVAGAALHQRQCTGLHELHFKSIIMSPHHH